MRTVEVVVPIAGVVVVLAAVLFVLELRLQIGLVVVGLLMVQIGVWKVATQMMPNERKYLALRREVDRFVALVRMLNTAALTLRVNESIEARKEFDTIREALHDAVEQMARVAGRTEAEVVMEPTVRPWA